MKILRMNAGLQDQEWVSFLKKWLSLSLLLHLVAAVMSVGFYDMDEHFQIMEFTGYLLGRTPISDLAHEYSHHLRSFLQPTFYEGIARTFQSIGIHTPSAWAFGFRLFSSLVGWMSLVGISLCSYSWFDKKKFRELSVLLAALLYFMPYLHSRPASESLGGSFFFLAVSLMILFGQKLQTKRSNSTHLQISSGITLVAGLLMGFAFLCRFQMGFSILAFGLWCLFIARVQFLKLLSMFGGFIIAIGIGVLTDWRAYGVLTLSAWNYFSYDILQGAAISANTFPWWAYFRFLNGDVPLLGNLISSSVILGWVAKPRHPLTWATSLFFLAHVLVAHKEPRYIFPLIDAVPVLIAFGCEWVSNHVLKKKKLSSFLTLRYARIIILTLNFGGLVIATLKPAAVQPLFQGYVFAHQSEIKKISYIQTNPFEVVGLQMHFYRPSGLEIQRANSFAEFSEKLRTENKPLWLSYIQFELPPDAGDLIQHCQLQYTVFPDFLRVLLFLPGLKMSSKASLFKCSL